MAAGACAYSQIIPVEIGDVIKPSGGCNQVATDREVCGLMAFVGTSFVKRGKVGNAKAKDTIRYIQHRTGKDHERVMRPLFTSDGPMTRLEAYQFIDEAPKGTKFFTFIMSPDPAIALH